MYKVVPSKIQKKSYRLHTNALLFCSGIIIIGRTYSTVLTTVRIGWLQGEPKHLNQAQLESLRRTGEFQVVE
jgi:hypothetical protein